MTDRGGGAFQDVPFLIAHQSNFWSIDLKNVETTLFGSSDKLNGVRAPGLSPVSVMYSNGIHVEGELI